MKYLIGLVVVVGLIYGGMIYSKSGSYQQPAATIMPAAGDVTVIKMEGNKFRFSQPEIKVKLGDKVKVVLTAVDMPHNFDLEELNVNGPIAQPGKTTIVEFTASELGVFEYFCSVGQHRANGMVGRLIVTE